MLDEFARQLAAYVRRVMARVEYVDLKPATVLGQSGQLLELELDQPTTLPRLTDVPIRHGLPGVTAVSVAPGSRVRVGFDGGDPRKPFAVLWDAGNATSVTFNGGTHEAARKGHAVRVTIPIGAVMVSSPGGPVPNGAEIPLDGTITEGAGVLRLP